MTHYENTDVDVSVVQMDGSIHATVQLRAGEGRDEAIARLNLELGKVCERYGCELEFVPEAPGCEGVLALETTTLGSVSKWDRRTSAEIRMILGMKEMKNVHRIEESQKPYPGAIIGEEIHRRFQEDMVREMGLPHVCFPVVRIEI